MKQGQWVKYTHVVEKNYILNFKTHSSYAPIRHESTRENSRTKKDGTGIFLGWSTVQSGEIWIDHEGSYFQSFGAEKVYVIAPKKHNNGQYKTMIRVYPNDCVEIDKFESSTEYDHLATRDNTKKPHFRMKLYKPLQGILLGWVMIPQGQSVEYRTFRTTGAEKLYYIIPLNNRNQFRIPVRIFGKEKI